MTMSRMKQRGIVSIKDVKRITRKKTIDLLPSKIFAKFAKEIALNSNGLIVDVASGYGRNAAFIASFHKLSCHFYCNDKCLRAALGKFDNSYVAF
jgi:hypothetical protein